MKAAVILFAVFIGCQAISNDDVSQQWAKFQKDFGKSYKSPLEARVRMTIFKQNLEKIEEHNALYEQGKVSWTMGITSFTDWTSDEFLKYVNKYPYQPTTIGNVFDSSNSTLSVPESMDWRDRGAVREVKNQGSCGGCWSFSTTGSVEGQYAISQNVIVSLSEQNLIDCVGQEYGCGGCNGGSMDGALQYLQQRGIVTESEYPYEAYNGVCRVSNGPYRVTNVYRVNPNEEALKEVIGTYGPVSVAIEATSNLQNYAGGVLWDTSCSGQLNHGVLAVGYGNQNGQDYWLIKNSWGAQWGESGFFKLARNRNNNCGVATDAAFPTL